MNFSDETVSKLVGAVQKARYMASCDIVSGNVAATTKEIDSRIVATILSSLTLADLMPWQPIETMRGDTQVLCASFDDTGVDAEVCINKEYAAAHGYTHWMSLPNPPTEAK